MSTEQYIQNEVIGKGKTLIKKAFEYLLSKDLDRSLSFVLDAQKLFKQEDSSENISVCLSLNGLIEYLKDKTRYLKSLTYLNDGKYLAEYLKDTTAGLVNEFALGEIDFLECNLETAIMHYNHAEKYAAVKDEYNLATLISKRLTQLKTGQVLPCKKDPLVALLKIGQAVSAETNIDVLLKVIAEETKLAIHADRCSVFLYDKKK